MLHRNDEEAPARDVVLPGLFQLQFEPHPDTVHVSQALSRTISALVAGWRPNDFDYSGVGARLMTTALEFELTICQGIPFHTPTCTDTLGICKQPGILAD